MNSIHWTYIQTCRPGGRMVDPFPSGDGDVPPIFMVAVETGNAPVLLLERRQKGGHPPILSKLWERHNRDDRPMGQVLRSMSVGDLIVLDGEVYLCRSMGWLHLGTSSLEDKVAGVARSLHRRGPPGYSGLVGVDFQKLLSQKFYP